MPTVFWARHGENAANVTRTLSHRLVDPDLTERGRRQVHELADRLGDELGRPETVAVARGARQGGTAGFAAVWCSPLRRARQTVEILCERLALPAPAVLEGLREIDVGDLDGRRDDAAWTTYDAVLAEWQAGRRSTRFPAGESGDELAGRLLEALRTAVEGIEGGATVLVVAHGGNLRAALPPLTGLPDPGRDMPTASVAGLSIDRAPGAGTAWAGREPPVRLIHWPE